MHDVCNARARASHSMSCASQKNTLSKQKRDQCQTVTMPCCLQMLHFLDAGVGDFHGAFCAALMRNDAADAADRKRSRSSPDECRSWSCNAHALELLLAKPHLADAVLASPMMRKQRTQRSLAELYAALPAGMHAAAARGHFGAGGEWCIHLRSKRDVNAAARTVELLAQPEQQHVTAVRVNFSLHSGPCSASSSVLMQLAQLMRLRACRLRTIEPCTWGTCSKVQDVLRPVVSWLAPLTGLESLELRSDMLTNSQLPVLAAVVTALRQLTSLALLDHDCEIYGSEPGLEAFAAALAQLTALVRLRMPKLACSAADRHESYSGAAAFSAALTSLSRLRDLDLNGIHAAFFPTTHLAVAVAACTALTNLSLARCGKWGVGFSAECIQILCNMPAQLSKLDLSQAFLGCSHVAKLLAAPALASIACLNLAATGLGDSLRTEGPQHVVWPWQELCVLPKLERLSLRANLLADCGAHALSEHISKLATLRVLDISCCEITGGAVLAGALFAMTQLEKLSCNQTMVGEHFKETFEDLLRRSVSSSSKVQLVARDELYDDDFAFGAMG